MTADFKFIDVNERTGLLRLVDLDRVARSLQAGGLAVLPTETGPMLAALCTSLDALAEAFRVKRRDPTHVMHIACSSLDMARRYAVIGPDAQQILGSLTPGPVTVVVPQTDALPRSFVTVNGTVGIRVPDNPSTLQVIAAVGAPLTATSLNVSGEETKPMEEALPSLDWRDGSHVFVVRDPTAVAYSSPSTLVRLTGSHLEVLRPGPVTEEMLRLCLKHT